MTTTRRGIVLGAGFALMAGRHKAQPAVIRIQHSSLQFSDDQSEHAHDARAVFDYARATGAALVSGTEAGAFGNSLRYQVPGAARVHGYEFHRTGGAFVAVAKRWGEVVARGYLPAEAGRGVPWVHVRPHDAAIGGVTYGAGHWFAHGRSNGRMAAAVGRWATRHGQGRAIVFYAADTNTNDRAADVFAGRRLTTCWDETGRHPATRLRCIDVVASFDPDARVSCRGAAVAPLFLFSDHRTISAAYRVAP